MAEKEASTKRAPGGGSQSRRAPAARSNRSPEEIAQANAVLQALIGLSPNVRPPQATGPQGGTGVMAPTPERRRTASPAMAMQQDLDPDQQQVALRANNRPYAQPFVPPQAGETPVAPTPDSRDLYFPPLPQYADLAPPQTPRTAPTLPQAAMASIAPPGAPIIPQAQAQAQPPVSLPQTPQPPQVPAAHPLMPPQPPQVPLPAIPPIRFAQAGPGQAAAFNRDLPSSQPVAPTGPVRVADRFTSRGPSAVSPGPTGPVPQAPQPQAADLPIRTANFPRGQLAAPFLTRGPRIGDGYTSPVSHTPSIQPGPNLRETQALAANEAFSNSQFTPSLPAPPAPAAPSPSPTRTAQPTAPVPAAAQSQSPQALPPTMGQQMPDVLKDQILQEALRIVNAGRQAPSGGPGPRPMARGVQPRAA